MRQSCVFKFQKWKDKTDVWKSYVYNIFQKVVPTGCMYKVRTSVKIVLKNYAHNLLLQNNFYV
jgi:transcription initiation factor IIE alpha subunit